MLSVLHWKEETVFQWKFPVCLWGNAAGSVLRRENIWVGKLNESRAASLHDKENETWKVKNTNPDFYQGARTTLSG